ncbi:MAG: hypothetical protein ABI488_14485 [Polyangiaceae bacterium]
MIDLETLGTLVGLPERAAAPLSYRAAIALGRRHCSGVRLTGSVLEEAIDEDLQWPETEVHAGAYEDINRVTEEGAEAIALALAGSFCSWRVKRRLQSRLAEGADWLLFDPRTDSTIVLEVGGTDEQDLAALLERKISQARRSPFSTRGTPAACVVRFVEPRAILWSDDGTR